MYHLNSPKIIQKRINALCKNEEIFNDSLVNYQKALSNSNFKHVLKYTGNNAYNKSNRPRKRKIIYYKPTFLFIRKDQPGKEIPTTNR